MYGIVVYVLMRLPLMTWCQCWSRQTGYEYQTESPSDQQQQQQQQQQCHDVISLDSHSKLVNDLSQQIVINSSQVCTLQSTSHLVQGVFYTLSGGYNPQLSYNTPGFLS